MAKVVVDGFELELPLRSAQKVSGAIGSLGARPFVVVRVQASDGVEVVLRLTAETSVIVIESPDPTEYAYSG